MSELLERAVANAQQSAWTAAKKLDPYTAGTAHNVVLEARMKTIEYTLATLVGAVTRTPETAHLEDYDRTLMALRDYWAAVAEEIEE